MKLRGVEWGYVFLASGTGNFFGEGWPQHRFYRLCPGFDLSGAVLIAKTTTVDERLPNNQTKGTGKGNMVIDPATLQPVDIKPDCIKIDYLRDRMTNAVSLSGPGAENLFNRNIWQKRHEKIVLSYMPVGKTKEERLAETRKYVDIAKKHIPYFCAPVAQELNVTCPNTGHCSAELFEETSDHLLNIDELGIPRILKLDVLVSIDFIKRIAGSGLCDAFDIPNSLKFGERPDRVDWKTLDYLTEPIVNKYNACGYSSRENFELAVEIIRDIRKAGVTLPIIGGGVSCVQDIQTMKDAGADAIAIGRASNTRFWRMKKMIKAANEIFGGE